MPELPPQLLLWITGASFGMLLATLAGVPLVVSRLPADYFSREQRGHWHDGHGGMHTVLALVKNLAGAVFLLAGVVMLVTPGQGVLTILVGLLLMNFPGKYRLERALVSRGGVFDALNWLRRRRGMEPFEPPR